MGQNMILRVLIIGTWPLAISYHVDIYYCNQSNKVGLQVHIFNPRPMNRTTVLD